jgi:hypothetical protein
MNRKKNESEAMELSRMDDILATEEELIPSSGFLAAVMESVREEAGTPAPIPFPWKRAVPGFVLAAGVFWWDAVELVRLGVPAMKGISLVAPHLPAAMVRPMEQVGWVALALGASLASWLLSRRLAGQSGLL